jgi:hypothetical protein
VAKRSLARNCGNPLKTFLRNDAFELAMGKTLVIINDGLDILKIGCTLFLIAHDMFFMFCADICLPPRTRNLFTEYLSVTISHFPFSHETLPAPFFYEISSEINSFYGNFSGNLLNSSYWEKTCPDPSLRRQAEALRLGPQAPPIFYIDNGIVITCWTVSWWVGYCTIVLAVYLCLRP